MSSREARKLFWKGLLWVNAAIILGFWWQGSGSLLQTDAAGGAIATGRLMGLAAAGSILLQFVFMGRTPWVERTFGLDKLSRIHSTSGKLSLLFLVLHPVLLTLGYSQVSGISLWAQYKSFLFEYEHVWLAAIGLLLFVIVVATSITIVRRRLRYEAWYFVHLLVYLAVFSSFWHQVNVGSDLLVNRAFYTYWIALYAVVLGSHVVFRFGRPVYLAAKHQFRVSRIVRENHNTVSVYISGKDLQKFVIYPGQFMIVRFFKRGMWWQAHPFSLSLLPNGKELRITVKELGDFTRLVSHVTTGTKLLIDGPYGVFTEWVSLSPKALFIAGGIGITPIRSLLEQFVQQKKDAVLLYANRTEQDIVFTTELQQLSTTQGARVVHVLSDQPGYRGETGRLDAEKIQRLVPDVATRDVYLCGPVPMMDALIAALQTIGVPLSHIHFEKFSLA